MKKCINNIILTISNNIAYYIYESIKLYLGAKMYLIIAIQFTNYLLQDSCPLAVHLFIFLDKLHSK